MKSLFALALTLSLSACAHSCSKANQPKTTPQFNADRAYQWIRNYEQFGPKIPGSDAHQQAGDWIVKTMKEMGLQVQEQRGEISTTGASPTPIRNIIAQYLPQRTKRILLSAHWDNRPFADQDEFKKNKPVPGVNDGGSGVVMLMEIAKSITSLKEGSDLDYGVDFMFWDAEDGGTPHQPNSYCLGSQYWAKNPVPADYRAEFGINFDMVGRVGAVFPIEHYSFQQAQNWVKRIRTTATKIGFGELFPDYFVGPIVDDHYYVSRGTGIPMVDLIHMTEDGRFPPEWHTRNDKSDVISRDVLKGVGQTVLQLIFDLKD